MSNFFDSVADFAVLLHSKYASVAFLWTRLKCLNSTEPLQSGSLLFITQSPGVLGTYLIDIRRIKG